MNYRTLPHLIRDSESEERLSSPATSGSERNPTPKPDMAIFELKILHLICMLR